MPNDSQTTEPEPLSDDMLRGLPKQVRCGWCKGTRADQVRLTYYANDDTPLCEMCWEKEYGYDTDR